MAADLHLLGLWLPSGICQSASMTRGVAQTKAIFSEVLTNGATELACDGWQLRPLRHEQAGARPKAVAPRAITTRGSPRPLRHPDRQLP
jgi:hypothetical protein